MYCGFCLAVVIPVLTFLPLFLLCCCFAACRNPGSMGKQYFVGLEKVQGGSGDPAYPGEQMHGVLVG